VNSRIFDRDEELVSLVSGDLQGAENGWVWQGSETGMTLQKYVHDEASRDGNPNEIPSSILQKQDIEEWGGWIAVERQLGALARGERAPEQILKVSKSHPPSSTQPPPSGNVRMSIANII
jgi:hypothetical protein